MKKFFVVLITLMMILPYFGMTSANAAGGDKPFSLIELSAKAEPGSVTLSWPKTSQSSIYLYRDYTTSEKPIATLNPTDTSYTDKTSGPHNYSLMVIGRDGAVALKSNLLPVWVPSACESSDGTVIKLWVDKTRMISDCAETTIKTPPSSINGSTYVSIRPIIEAAGGTLLWNGDTRTATISLPPNTVSLTIGSRNAKVNGADKQISTNPKVVPVIVNGTTMLPFRFIIENLGGTVGWDANEKRMDILLPLQPNKAIARAMNAFSTLSQGKLGQMVECGSVESVTTTNPAGDFLTGAKILHYSSEKPTATPLLDVVDTNGRKLEFSNLKTQFNDIDANLSLYKVNIKSRNSQLPSFTTTVLFNNETGDMIDATFLPSTLGFAFEQGSLNATLKGKGEFSQLVASYKIGYSSAKLSGGKLSFAVNTILFNTTASGKMTTVTPGCTPCQLGRTDIYAEFKNTCPDDISPSAKINLPIISNLYDFSLGLGSVGEQVGFSIDQGCGFFPSSSCPDVTEKQSEMAFEIADFRPATATDNPRTASVPVKGVVRLLGKTGWFPETVSDKTKNYITFKLPSDPKPRTMSLAFGGSKNYGSFTLSAMTTSQYPGNPPRFSIKVPLLSSPAGNQVGIFKMIAKASLTILSPVDLISGWFAQSGRKVAQFGGDEIQAKSEFDCPCSGSLKAIEDAKLAVETKGDLSVVTITCRINTDAAFRNDSDKVEVQLFRNDEPLDTITVVKSNPNVTLSDGDPYAGETYKYCIKCTVNSKVIDEWCNEEEITPMPSSFNMTWPNNTTSFSAKIMAGDKFYLKIKVVNTSDSEIKVSLYLKPPCRAWKVSFTNQALSTVITVPANGTNLSTQLAVTPDVGLSGGEVCEFIVEAVSGKQKKVIKLKATTEAAQCAYVAQWNEGGTGIGGDTSAGIQNVQSFTIKNTGNEINKFIIDLGYDRLGSTAQQQWLLRFGNDYVPGMTLNLKPGESREIQVFCRAANDMPDGEKIKVTVSVQACGEKALLVWLLNNKLDECAFDLDWEKGTLTKSMSSYPSEKFYMNFTVKNNMDTDSLFLITSEAKGEKMDVSAQYYELQMGSGEARNVRLTCVTDQKARIGQSKIYVYANCGKTHKTLSVTVNIRKQEECAYAISWDSNGKDTQSSDMPIDEPVETNVRVVNKSLTEQYFAVKVERSIEAWITGISEKTILKQTFTLNPGQEVNTLIIQATAGKETQIGEKCTVTVTIKACGGVQTLKWEVTCVPHQELDASFVAKMSDATWLNDGRLMVPGLFSFQRQGVGLIKTNKFGFEFYDADNFDATLGKTDMLPVDVTVENGTAPWSYNLRIPASVVSKAQANGSSNIKVVMTIKFLFEKNKVQSLVDKSITFIVAIPGK